MGALFEIVMNTVAWQQEIEKTQQVVAHFISLLSKVLMWVYEETNKLLDSFMRDKDKQGNPRGKPKKPKEEDTTWATEIQAWQTEYNEFNQKVQQLTTQKNTCLQTNGQHEQSLGNAAQQSSTMVVTAIQPLNFAARQTAY